MGRKKEFSIITMLVPAFFLLSSVLRYLISYLRNALDPFNGISAFFFFYCLVGGLFLYKNYYNKKLFQLIGVVILGLMLVYIYTLPSKWVDSLFLACSGIITVALFFLVFYQPKEWEKYQKEIEQKDEVVE